MSSFYPLVIGLPARLAGLLLALAVTGPVAANPFGVARQGGDSIAAIRSPAAAWSSAISLASSTGEDSAAVAAVAPSKSPQTSSVKRQRTM